MANNLPNLNIPVTVQTDGVDRGLSAVERKLRNSAAKMKRLGAAAGAPTAPSGLSLKASQGTALLGGVGKLGALSGALGGLGGAGLAMAAPLAMFGVAAQAVQQMAQMTKGATEALALFKQTGEQTFAVNSVVLERLAKMESGAQLAAQLPGYTEAFALGSARPGEQSMLATLNEFGVQASAFLGAIAGGKTMEQARLEAALVTASEAQARAISQQLAALEKQRFDVTLGDVLNPLATLPQKIDQIAIYLGKL